MGQRFANLPQQIQYVDNNTAPGGFSLDLEFVSVSLSKSRELVVRESENLSQRSDYFVARSRIDHDGEQCREPRVRWMFGLTITFRLDLDGNFLF